MGRGKYYLFNTLKMDKGILRYFLTDSFILHTFCHVLCSGAFQNPFGLFFVVYNKQERKYFNFKAKRRFCFKDNTLRPVQFHFLLFFYIFPLSGYNTFF
ncbi:hypothetical protein DW103_11740 [Parabacteroides sp. AM08-6]|nr:hypothetical protein DW103_11740 [Parabacteroides sp. AM08-6]